MKKIAIITPGFLPVPAVNGGAIETLITYILEENENRNKLMIDLYTIDDYKLKDFNYLYTNIISSKFTKVDKINIFKSKCINKLCNILKINFGIGINDKKIVNSLTDNNYDYIMVENNMHIFKLVHKKYNGKAKFIFHLHNSIENDPAKSSIFSQYISDNADLILTASRFLKNQFIKKHKNKNVIELTNCTDFNKFMPLPNNIIENFKMKNKLNENDFLIAYSGRLTPEKGILELLLAFEDIIKMNFNCKLIIAGQNCFKSYTENNYTNLIKSICNRMTENIIFTGYIEHNLIPILYNTCSVTVVPSTCEEAFGLTALESLACGTPVIATNIGGLPEVVSNKVGILVDVDKNLRKNLRENILCLIQNRKKLNVLSENSRIYSVNNFNDKEKYFEKFYDEILKLNNK